MKRIGVAGIIHHNYGILLGRRGKDPNRGLFVLPGGGGVEEGETLEQAFQRELLEETGIEVEPTIGYSRWERPDVIELPDRLILVAKAYVKPDKAIIKAGSDLYDVGWYDFLKLPTDISPVILPLLRAWGFRTESTK